MADDVGGAEEEKLGLGRYLLQIPAQEDTLVSIASQGDRGLNATGIVDITNKAISSGETYQFVNVAQLGLLEECLVVSPSTEFSLILNIDGKQVDKTYQGFCDITQTVEDISAFEERDEDGNPTQKYIVHLANINFKNSVSIKVRNDSGAFITFHNLFCKYKTM